MHVLRNLPDKIHSEKVYERVICMEPTSLMVCSQNTGRSIQCSTGKLAIIDPNLK